VLEANAFLRHVLVEDFDPYAHCHRPIVVTDPDMPLGRVLRELTVEAEHPGDDVIDQDVVLLWSGDNRRVITGSDLLGRLLRGITQRTQAEPAASE
jgi:metal transporter CNNM